MRFLAGSCRISRSPSEAEEGTGRGKTVFKSLAVANVPAVRCGGDTKGNWPPV